MGQVLWFSGPPANVARPHPPQHTLTYLNFLASKRTSKDEHADAPASKKRFTPTSQLVRAAWAETEKSMDTVPVRPT